MGIRINDREFKSLLKDLSKMPKGVVKEALPKAKRHTPIDKGNARSKTRVEQGTTIASRYPYAERLDTGWSKQAPNGFTDPTIDDMDKIVEQKVRKLNG